MGNPVVGMRVTEEEYETIKSLAKASGMNDISAYCRTLIRREMRKKERPSKRGAGTQPLLISKDEFKTCGPGDKHDALWDDTSRSFQVLREEIRTEMRDVFKKMQHGFEHTAARGLRLVKETTAGLADQVDRAGKDICEKFEQTQRAGTTMLEQQFQRYEKIARKEIQETRSARVLVKQDLDATKEAIEGTLKINTADFKTVLNPAVTVLKKFRVETLKLKKAVWLSAVFTMFSLCLPAGGWLVYKYERQCNITEVWSRNAHRINQYVMENFYPGLDEEGMKKINEYYAKYDLTTPEEQTRALE